MKTKVIAVAVLMLAGRRYVNGQTAGQAEFIDTGERQRLTPGTYSFKNDGGNVPPVQLTRSLGVAFVIDADYIRWEMNVAGDTAKSDASAYTLSPRIALLYGLSESVSVEGGVKFLRGEDGSAEMSALRLSMGPRIDFSEHSDLKPHVKAGLCLYSHIEAERLSATPALLSADSKDSAGFYLSAGIDYVVTENSLIGITVNYEQLLGESDLESGLTGDFELSGFGLGFSYMLLF